MIQTYSDLKAQVDLINNYFEGQVFLQKVYSSSQFISFSLRGDGQNRFLFLGRGSGHEGLWLGEKQITSFLRKRDVFLEYLRKHLSSVRLVSIEIDNEDRIITIYYMKWGVRNAFSFFYNGRMMYFSNLYYDEKKELFLLFRSWKKEVETYDIFDTKVFNEVGRREINKGFVQKNIEPIELLLAKEEIKAKKGSKKIIKVEKFIKRKIKNIKNDLEKVAKFQKLEKFVSNEENLEKLPREFVFENIKIKFKFIDHYKRRDEIYLKIKSLKKAQSILTKRLADALEKDSEGSVEQDINSLVPIKPFWNTRNVKINTEPLIIKEETYHVYEFENFNIGVGINSLGNEKIRKNWAQKEDYWFHLDETTSAHAIVKFKGETDLMKCFEIVGSIILNYTKLTNSEANLVYTQVKNLRSVSKARGSVRFKKEKRIKIIRNEKWREEILYS